MKIKRMIAAVTALVLVGGATAANTIGSVFAEDAETSAETTAAEENIIVKDGIKYAVRDGKAVVMGLDDETIVDVVIADEVEGAPVVEIGKEAFSKTKIRSVVLGKNVVHIGKSAFLLCVRLGNVTLNDALEEIDDCAFEFCTEITKITTGSMLKKVGKNAFYFCLYLSEIELGENVSEIGRGAFGCTSIDVLELPEKVEFIDNIFSDMYTSTKNEIYKITNTVIIKNPECEIETRSGEWGDVLIVCDENSAAMENAKKSNARCCTPEQYEKGEYDKVEVSPLDIFVCIKKYGMMFKETEDGLEVGKICCVKNGTVVIPDEVGGIPVVKYDYGVEATREGSDIFISIEDRIIEQYIDEIEKIVIGKNVKLLGPGAFTQCKNIKSVEGGEGLEKIGDQAFFELDKLEKFDFSDKLKEIESYAFYGCSSLKALELPDSLEKIGVGVFSGCSNVASVKLPENIETIKMGTFSLCYGLASVELPEKVKEIENYAFHGCCNLTDVKLNNALEKIGANSFSECVSLDNIIIPDKVSTIGEAAFKDTHISTLVLPESVKNIGRDAFSCFSGDYKDRNEKVLVSVPKVDRVELKVLNPECEIEGDPFYKNSKDVYMYGYADSTAWNFAHKNQVLDFYAFGDANNDYQVDMSDIVLIMQSLANPNKYGLEGTDEHHITQKGIDCADVDNAGNGVTANDALKIQKYLLGQEKLV